MKANHANEDQIRIEREEKLSWCQKFIEKGGYNFIHKIFVEMPKQEMCSDLLKHKAIYLQIKLIRYFLSKNMFKFVKETLEPS